MKRFFSSMILAMLVLGSSSAASAAEKESLEAARLFRKGRDELKKGRVKEALALFSQSEALEHSSRTQLNIADCEVKSGRIVAALIIYRSLLASNSASWKHVEFVKRNIAALTPRVARVHLRLPAIEPKGLVIKIDGRELTSRDYKGDIEVDPGLHPFAAFAPNYQEFRHIIAVHAGQTVHSPPIQLQPIRKVALLNPTKREAAKTHWPATVIGAGGVMIGFGAVMIGTGLLARKAGEETFNAATAPQSGMRTNSERATYGAQTAHLGEREFNTGLAFGAVGLAAVVIGGRWLASWENTIPKVQVRPALSITKTEFGMSAAIAF